MWQSCAVCRIIFANCWYWPEYCRVSFFVCARRRALSWLILCWCVGHRDSPGCPSSPQSIHGLGNLGILAPTCSFKRDCTQTEYSNHRYRTGGTHRDTRRIGYLYADSGCRVTLGTAVVIGWHYCSFSFSCSLATHSAQSKHLHTVNPLVVHIAEVL